MKSPYVNELDINKPVTASFLVQSKEVREKKTGEPYLSLLLGDKTGKVDAKMWDNVAEVIDAFDRDHFVKVKGLVQLHMNRPQITIHKIRILRDDEVDFADYFPASLRDRDEMWGELRATVARVGNAHIRGLLDALLDDEDVSKRYRLAPAAKNIHHAYLGGLLEHVLSLCNLCRLTASHYANIDPDLMIAGAVLHDIGKIYELTYDRGFGYSTEGQLLGHMMIALRMMSDKLRTLPDFPPALRTMLEHMVISHHGKLEFGSPKLPLFPEALLLHYLDDMDSKMECMRFLIDGDRQSENCFTSYNMALERTVFKKDRFFTPATRVEEPVAKSAPVPVVEPPRPPANSPFGDKLQLALIGEPAADSKGLKKILIRATNWVGDAVMSLPAVRAVAARYPQAEVSVLARPWVADLYGRESAIARVIPYAARPGWHELAPKWNITRELKAEKFDCAILFQNAFEAAAVARLAGIPRIVGFNRDGRGFLLSDRVPVPKQGEIPRHERFYYLELLRRAGIIDDFGKDEPILLENAAAAADAGRTLFGARGIGGPVTGVSPGAAYGNAKRWLPERFAEAAMALGGTVALFGSAAERELCGQIARLMGARAHNLAGETTLRQFIDMTAACRLFLTNDSGAMHIASALGVPSVTIFGPTDDTTTGPTGTLARIVREPVECSPCLLRECPIDHRCMTRVPASRVVNAARELGIMDGVPRP